MKDLQEKLNLIFKDTNMLMGFAKIEHGSIETEKFK